MLNANIEWIGGITIQEWNESWIKIEDGICEYKPQLRRMCGIFIIRWKNKIMYIGQAVDKRGGLGKRLRDFSRASASGRSHAAGKLIYDNLDGLTVEVLITGSDDEACGVAKELKKAMIRLLQPIWNVRHVPYRPTMRRRRRRR